MTPIPIAGGARMGQPSRMFMCLMCKRRHTTMKLHQAKDTRGVWVGPYCGECARKFDAWRATPMKEIKNLTPRRIP